MTSLAQRLQLLSERERMFLIAGGMFLLGLVIWFVLLSPAYNYYQKGLTSVQEGSELRQWMDDNRAGFERLALESTGAQQADVDLLQTINRLSDEYTLKSAASSPLWMTVFEVHILVLLSPPFCNLPSTLKPKVFKLKP